MMERFRSRSVPLEADTYYITSGDVHILITRSMEEAEGIVNQAEPRYSAWRKQIYIPKGATRAPRLSVASPNHLFIIDW